MGVLTMSRQALWFGGLYFVSIATLGLLTFLERSALRLLITGAQKLSGL
jgi:hypothetical protein